MERRLGARYLTGRLRSTGLGESVPDDEGSKPASSAI